MQMKRVFCFYFKKKVRITHIQKICVNFAPNILPTTPPAICFMRTMFDYVLWAIALVFFVIGIDQSVKGFQSYWAFMISVGALLGLNFRKLQNPPLPQGNTTAEKEEFLEKKAKTQKTRSPAKKRKR